MGFGGGGGSAPASPPPPPTTVPMRQLTEVQPQAQGGNVRSFMDAGAAAAAGLSPFSFNDQNGKTVLGS